MGFKGIQYIPGTRNAHIFTLPCIVHSVRLNTGTWNGLYCVIGVRNMTDLFDGMPLQTSVANFKKLV